MFRARIVKIGNSQGIRIPRPLLEQAGLKTNVKLRAEKGRLVVMSDDEPRLGWAEAFSQADANSGSPVIETEQWPLNEFDKKEWTW